MQKGQTGIFILAGVLVLFAVAGIAFYLGRQTNKPLLQNTVITSQISQPTPSFSPVDEVANWKTYKNNQLGFEFKYPQNYIINAIDATANPNCDYLTDAQSSCLVVLTFKVSDSDYAPKASFYLLKGINTVEIPGQISSINFNQQKKAWIFIQSFSPDQLIPTWDYSKSGQEIIKSSNGGSHGSSSFYIIPDYQQDIVAIFAIPQSYRLRCDNFTYLNDIPKQTQCNDFYNDVIQKYNGGQITEDTWLPGNYLKKLYQDAETMVRSMIYSR